MNEGLDAEVAKAEEEMEAVISKGLKWANICTR